MHHAVLISMWYVSVVICNEGAQVSALGPAIGLGACMRNGRTRGVQPAVLSHGTWQHAVLCRVQVCDTCWARALVKGRQYPSWAKHKEAACGSPHTCGCAGCIQCALSGLIEAYVYMGDCSCLHDSAVSCGLKLRVDLLRNIVCSVYMSDLGDHACMAVGCAAGHKDGRLHGTCMHDNRHGTDEGNSPV